MSTGGHLLLASIKGSGFVTNLGISLCRGVSRCVSDGTSMNPPLVKVSKDDDNDSGDDAFAVIRVSLGIGVGLLLVEPFDGESPKEELDPTNSRLKKDEVVEVFGEVAFVDVG